MNSTSKRKILVGLVIILLIINISALSTIMYKNNQVKSRIEKEEFLRQEEQNRGMNYFFKNELNLSDEQFESFQTINDKYFKNSHEIAYNLQNNRILLIEEIAKLNPNTKNLDNIAREIGDLHYKLKVNTIDHFMELKSLCNEEQQEKLQHFFFRMIDDQDNNRQYKRRNRPHGDRNGMNKDRMGPNAERNGNNKGDRNRRRRPAN